MCAESLLFELLPGDLCRPPLDPKCSRPGHASATSNGYNAAQQVTDFKYGNGLFASFGFSSDRLQLNCLDYSSTNRGGACTHDGTTKFGLGYSYGSAGSNNGQIASVADSVDSGRSAAYTYDALYRLSTAATTGSAGYPAWGISMAYDRYGNRTDQNQALGNPPMNHLTIDATTNRISGDCYDASGNLLAESALPCPSPTYTYDGENRLAAYSGSAAYSYDGNGLRIQKCLPNCTSPTSSTVYIFSGSKVIAEYDNGAAPASPSREYIYSGGALLAKIDSSSTKYYHRDHLSNRLVTDSSGNTVAQLGHFPFGESWYNSTSDKLLFTTYERDAESGNDYAMARYNMSRLARFSRPDPIAGTRAVPQSLNRYAYVLNQPTRLVDSSGLRPGCERGDATCNAESLDAVFARLQVCRMGGCTGTFGMDIFDALAGAAGTYTYYDIYGNLSWGFSQELYQFVASSDCQGYNCLAMTGWNYDVHDFGSASIASGFLADKIAAAEEAAWLNAVFPGSIDTITSYIRVNILMALNQRLNPLDPKIRDQILGNAIAEYVSSTGIGNEWAAYFYGYFSSPILPPH